MLEKQILLEQIDDRIKKGLAMVIDYYPELYAGTLEEELAKGVLDILDGLKALITAVADIQYNNNIEHYKDVIYDVALKESGNE